MNKVRIILNFTILALLIFIIREEKCISAPVIPNESTIEGVVSEYAVLSSRLIGMQPNQLLYRLTIYIESSKSVGDGPNFLKNKKGLDIKFYTKEKLSPELFGKRVKLKVKYQGDEKGGIFWIIGIE